MTRPVEISFIADAADLRERAGRVAMILPAAPRELNGFFAFHTVPPGPPFPEEIHLRSVCGVVWCYVGSEADAAAAMAPLLGFIITGTFVIEIIFSIPGIGRYFVTAISSRDYSVVMGITVLTSVIIIIANLVVDILYGILDPRTRDART